MIPTLDRDGSNSTTIDDNVYTLFYDRFAISLITVTLIISLSVLAGWYLNIPQLTSLLPNYLPMKISTAIAFILSCLAALLQNRNFESRIANAVAKAIATIVTLYGALILFEYIFNYDLYIDHVFENKDTAWAIIPPGRPSQMTAIALIFLGGSLLTLNIKKLSLINQACDLSTLFSGLLMISSLSFDPENNSQIINMTSASIFTSISFVLLSIAIILLNSNNGIMILLSSKTNGGTIARVLLPTIILIPLLFSVLSLLGERHGLHDVISGTAIYTLITISLLVLICYILSYQLMLSEDKKQLISQQLKQSEKRFHDLMELAPIGMAVITKDGRFGETNYAFTKITGFHPESLSKLFFNDLFSAQLRLYSHDYLKQYDEYFTRHDGSQIWLQIILSPLYDENTNKTVSYIVQIEDISIRKDYEDRIHDLAYHDPLTNLPNRRLLLDRVSHTITMTKRHNKILAILLLDLDNFKNVNDTLGHDIGDELLKSVAIRFTSIVRQEDTVARISGDEFIILLNEITKGEDAGLVANQIIDHISQPFYIMGQSVCIGVSIGIALYPHQGNDPTQLLKAADNAMYMAKKSGKNRYIFAK